MSSITVRVADKSFGYSRLFTSLLLGGALFVGAPAHATPYQERSLVTDDPAYLAAHGLSPAVTVDPNLVNPWGISHSGGSPFWISDNGTGLTTLYNTFGAPTGVVQVTIPLPGGSLDPHSSPTGTVFNGTGGVLSGDRFIFATEQGLIAGWSAGSSALIRVDNSASNAIYKGLAIAPNGGNPILYAADFHNGTIDVFDSTYTPITVPGKFTDPTLPAGYAPFNIQLLGDKLYVTYAVQDAAGEDDVAGAGNGIVDVFDLNGNLVARAITGGKLNSPWGLDIAPSGFGQFANDLLVGNFGDGTINAFDPVSFAYVGTLMDVTKNPISIEGLWGLINGNGGNGGDPDFVYFTAGIDDENHGLFGALVAVPEPGTLALFGAGLIGLSRMRRRKV